MGLWDRLLGRPERPAWQSQGEYPQPGGYPPQGGYPGQYPSQPQPGGPQDADARAVDRYRYLLRTAPPETIEQAHAEAFAQLTPDQRRQVLEQLSAETPPAERTSSDDPRSLARMATRAEMRRPGTLERSFGGAGTGGMGGMGGIGMGGLVAGSLLSSIAGAFIGTAIADAMFDMSDSGLGDGDTAAADAGGGDASADGYADDGAGGGDVGGGDYGGDFGGGDFGGGDFGGDF